MAYSDSFSPPSHPSDHCSPSRTTLFSTILPAKFATSSNEADHAGLEPGSSRRLPPRKSKKDLKHWRADHSVASSSKFTVRDHNLKKRTTKPRNKHIEGGSSIECRLRSAGPSQGVDFTSIPSAQSSRRTTIFVGPNPSSKDSDLSLSVHQGRKDTDRSSRSTKMHRAVNSDDYLLARGANPRTGVVTPGTHSANNSVDQSHAAHDSNLPGRWRQKGDQWVSLDLGEPSPPDSAPLEQSVAHRRYELQDVQALEDSGLVQMKSGHEPSRHYIQHDRASEAPSYDSTTTFHLRPLAEGIGMYPELTGDSPLKHVTVVQESTDRKLRRKPVGSRAGKQPTMERSRDHTEAEGSTDTVVRKLHFASDLRSSSAPEPPRIRNFTPADVGKDLPALPQEHPAPGPQDLATLDPADAFLGQPAANLDSKVNDSKPSHTYGLLQAEKGLPCLPTNNGRSPLKQETMLTLPNSVEESNEIHFVQPNWQQQRPQGPRGGVPDYPFVRTARPAYHQPHVQRQLRPNGARQMPIPIYDNPPVSLPCQPTMAGPRAAGPRSMPPSRVNMSAATRDLFGQSLNTTFTPTNMFMAPRPSPALPPTGPRAHPRPFNHRMMNHERLGSLPTDIQQAPYSTSMSTSMNTDFLMSFPMRRVRPRAMSRPLMVTHPDTQHTISSQDARDYQPGAPRRGYTPEWDTVGTDSQMWEAAYQEEARLVPHPLRPRLNTDQIETLAQADGTAMQTLKQQSPTGLGLTRKCSRCHDGFVGVRPLDSATRTSGPQNRTEPNEEQGKRGHPTGRTLPVVPDVELRRNGGKDNPESNTTHDERDHSICCPTCCRDQDCHEGCLGHPSPSSTPNTSPTKSIWSEVECASSSSESEGWDDDHDKDSLTSEKFRVGRLAFVKAAFKRSPKKRQAKFDGTGHSSPDTMSSTNGSPTEFSLIAPTPTTPSSVGSEGSKTDGLNEAMNAAGKIQRKSSGRNVLHKQRSTSSPSIGVGVFSCTSSGSTSQRTVSGSRLRVPAPKGLAIACSGIPKSRNVSGNSVATLELQVPGLGTLGFGALGEMVIVPFEATKMWIRNHPQVMKVAWEGLERAWQMSQLIATTAWRLWALVFVYSKTGKLRLSGAKGEGAGGFVLDCVRSGAYLLIFMAVGVFAMRVLNIFIGAFSLIGWLFKGFFWVFKQVLGCGLAR